MNRLYTAIAVASSNPVIVAFFYLSFIFVCIYLLIQLIEYNSQSIPKLSVAEYRFNSSKQNSPYPIESMHSVACHIRRLSCVLMSNLRNTLFKC